jgi:hypothetical protein
LPKVENIIWGIGADVTELDELLGGLIGSLAPIRNVALKLSGPDTRVDPISGAICVSHRPRIAPEAYAIRLFPPADESVIASYEKIHALTILETYRTTLRRVNGATIFDMALFGIPPSMAREPPVIDRSTAWPLDIGTAQTKWRIRYKAAATDLFIGSGPWTPNEHLGYFLSPNGEVRAVRRGGDPFGSWTGIEDFLKAELRRAEDLYPAPDNTV